MESKTGEKCSKFCWSRSAPQLDSFSSYFITQDPNVAVMKVTGTGVITSSSNLKQEFDLLIQILNERYKRTNLEYPATFATEISTSYFLYSTVRILKPANIAETGVANGHSSYFILKALSKNQSGNLHSFDVNNNVGKLIAEDEKKRWDLNILPRRRRKKVFRYTMKKYRDVDIFIHDSNHFYYWQMFEHKTAWEFLKSGGLLLSDDVDSSYAFLDYCEKISTKPSFLIDSRKIFGVLVKNS